MDKKELYNKVGDLDLFCIGIRKYVALSEVLYLIKQLDEPQKVVIPQYVADWYEEYKDNLEYNIWDWMKYNLEPKKRENVIFSQWLGKTVNNPVEILIKMKLYGYEVEKEKRYLVKMKGFYGYDSYLNKALSSGEYFLDSENEVDGYRTKHTREELEQDNFGWVFSCEGVEVKEVE